MKNILALVVATCFLLLTGFQSRAEESAEKKEPVQKQEDYTEKWGIKIVSLRPTASDRMLDLRYRIVNSEKAAGIMKKGQKAYVVQESTGYILSVPVTKLGPMRSTAVKPKENRVYVVLFGNGNGIVKKGDFVTLVIGDLKVEHVPVQ